jgi:hypothetical protein
MSIFESPSKKITVPVKRIKFKKLLLREYKKGNVVFITQEGLQSVNLSEFINNPTVILLNDLSRSEEFILKFIDDPKWINDFAVCKVITALKLKIQKLENIKK